MNTALDQFRMKKALIVEDHPDLLDALARQLKRLGFAVISASNGKEGVKKAIKENPDLILMDIMMPRVNGLEATRKMRSNQETKDIPILAITGFHLESELRECIEAGCNDYVVKPFTIKKLQEKIQATIPFLKRNANRLAGTSS